MGLKTAVAIGMTGLITALGGAFALSSGTGCTPSQVDVSAVAQLGTHISGFSGDQLLNAAQIMNAATAAGLSSQAQVIGVMTAIGESGLRNLTYGDAIHGVTNPDGTPTSSLGLFQQQQWWGSVKDRLDPSLAAAKFFSRLAGLPNWEKLTPTAAAHAIQANADPNYYTPFVKPASEIVATLAANSTGNNCGMNADSQALALELVTHLDDGTLSGPKRHMAEIRSIAQGTIVPNCGIDERILQVMVIAVRQFNHVGVSSINRKCTGEILGAGALSSHYINGGGHAVDFNNLDYHKLNGADGLSLRLIGLLDPLMPSGSRIGQSECRAKAGDSLSLKHFGQFDDFCTHLHVEVASAPAQLSLN
jgi:hypothetical protein